MIERHKKKEKCIRGIIYHCSHCGEPGHNIQNCQNPPKPPGPKPLRKGKPGNLSGLQHGFFTPRFAQGEVAMLELMDEYADIDSEIKLVWVALDRAIKMMTGDIDVQKTISLLNLITMGAVKLNNMKRIKKLVFGEDETLSDFMEGALAEVIEEFEREGEQMRVEQTRKKALGLDPAAPGSPEPA